MKTSSAIALKIASWVEANCLPEGASTRVKPDTGLLSGEMLSSIQFLHLVAYLEKEYTFKFDPDDLVPEHFESPAALGQLVSGRLGAGSGRK